MTGGSSKRFDVELFIVHPSLLPSDISRELGLEAQITHCVGTQRMTPKGNLLSGLYVDTRWRYSRRFVTPKQHFVYKAAELVEYLEPRTEFFQKLRSGGGKAQLLFQFLGDGYFGDVLPYEILFKIANIGLDLGIECYTVPQNGFMDSPRDRSF